MVELSKLVAIDPRDVWPQEAYDFTPWLLQNADTLAGVLGIDIELTAAEHPVGGFNLDLIGQDLTNQCVLIVENQLTPTDHIHLGQVLTYAAGTEARTIIWAATRFREEHRQAIDWLNELAGENARFFGVEIGAVKIGDSPPAPLFKLRAQPNDWHSQVAAAAKSTSQTSGKAPLYVAFWTRYLDRVHAERPGWTNAQKPSTANWISMPSPFKGANYSQSFAAGGKIRDELYIDSVDAALADGLYAFLADRKAQIEAVYGQELSWEPLPDKRASRIASYSIGNVSDVDSHDKVIDWLFESGAKLRAALTPHAKDWAVVVQSGDYLGIQDVD